MAREKQPKRAIPYRTVILAAAFLVLGGKWYTYVAHAESPFDPFGSGLNSIMPGPLNRYGCDRLKQRFGNIPIPPRGCSIGGRWA